MSDFCGCLQLYFMRQHLYETRRHFPGVCVGVGVGVGVGVCRCVCMCV